METWRKVWREGVSKVLSLECLQSLKLGLQTDSNELIQGATTTPPPLVCVQDHSCEAGCALAYAGWKGMTLQTVGEVEEFFARVCFEADQKIGEPAAIRHFLNWFDDSPRDLMIRDLLTEVEKSINDRVAKSEVQEDSLLRARLHPTEAIRDDEATLLQRLPAEDYA